MKRRESLKIMAASVVAAGLPGCAPAEVERARAAVDALPDGAFEGYQAGFFTDHEMTIVRRLADIIIPADDRSGSASDARVPEFIDFTVGDRPDMQTPIRGGLAWMDYRCVRLFGVDFMTCTAAQQLQVVDEIAWPDQASAEVSQGVQFFNRFRDLTASGFWSSRMGVEDLAYTGNTARPVWDGCPPDAMKHLGL